MPALKRWKSLTTTTNAVEPQDLDQEPYRVPLGQVKVGKVELPTGRPAQKADKDELENLIKFLPHRFLGYTNVPDGGPPTHPGEMLIEEFLKPLGISQRQLAGAIRLPYRQVNNIIRERRPVTPVVALRLTRYLGMSVGFWMNLQLAWDLYHAARNEAEILSDIEPFPRPDLAAHSAIQEKD